MPSKAKLIITLILLVLLAIVIFQNSGPVETDLLFWTTTVPQALLILVVLAIGFLGGLLSAGFLFRKSKRID